MNFPALRLLQSRLNKSLRIVHVHFQHTRKKLNSECLETRLCRQQDVGTYLLLFTVGCPGSYRDSDPSVVGVYETSFLDGGFQSFR